LGIAAVERRVSNSHRPAGWLAIVNPMAGARRPAQWYRALAGRLRRDLGARVAFTHRAGHAAQLAPAPWADRLAVFGGDGTLAEVVNAMDLERQALLVVAGGTGNGLARDLGLTSLRASLQAGRRDRRRALDLVRVRFCDAAGHLRQRLMVSTASLGYAAEVVRLAAYLPKRLGSLCYTLAAGAQAFRQGTFALSLSVDGGPFERRCLSNIVVNNTCHAGNFPAFPQAGLSDGKFDVHMARAGAGLQLVYDLTTLARTQALVPLPAFAARCLTCRLDQPQRLMLDGELWESVTEVDFQVEPRQAQCLH
jgi:diacylglycerol kinase family enzyme